MRVPNEIKKAEENHKLSTNNEVIDVDMQDELEFLSIPEDEEKFNKYIEKIIRSSFEYNEWVGILVNDMDITKSKFFPEVDTNDKGLSIEMHHYPLSLYDIVSLYRRRMIEDNEQYLSYNPFYVAEKVMELHFKGVVSIVPLDKTTHELYHSGNLFIPLSKDYVFGNWKRLFDDGYLVEDASIKEKLDLLEDRTDKIEKGELDQPLEIISKRQIVIKDINGIEAPKFIED